MVRGGGRAGLGCDIRCLKLFAGMIGESVDIRSKNLGRCTKAKSLDSHTKRAYRRQLRHAARIAIPPAVEKEAEATTGEEDGL